MRHPAALKNVTFDGTLNVNATQYLDIGGISKNNAGTIENCVSRVNINVDGAKVRVGGIVSQNVGTVKNCTNEGDIYGTISEAGGIIGSNGGALVSDCVNKGNITIKNADEYAYRVGGIIADDGDYDLPHLAHQEQRFRQLDSRLDRQGQNGQLPRERNRLGTFPRALLGYAAPHLGLRRLRRNDRDRLESGTEREGRYRGRYRTSQALRR